MQLDRNETLSGQVILLPASGKKIDPDIQITAENIEEFVPSPEAYLIASGSFVSLGFRAGPLVGVTFSITASAGTFEDVFRTKLQRSAKGGIECIAGGLELPLDQLPENVRTNVQTVTFTEPPDFGPTEF